MRSMGFCPTTGGFGFGSSLGFHVEGRGLDPGGLLCILLLDDSAPCVGCTSLCLTSIIPARWLGS